MSPLVPGQRWAYRTRPGEEQSTVLILKREVLNEVPVVHLHIDGLHLHNPYSTGGVQTELTHAPVAEDAVQDSVTTLLAEHVPLPPDQGGYEHWLGLYQRGEAGIFTLTVAEILRALEETVNRPPTTAMPTLFQKSKLK